jgi:hypothetical protein
MTIANKNNPPLIQHSLSIALSGYSSLIANRL